MNQDPELAEVAEVFVKEDEKRRSLKEAVIASAWVATKYINNFV